MIHPDRGTWTIQRWFGRRRFLTTKLISLCQATKWEFGMLKKKKNWHNFFHWVVLLNTLWKSSCKSFVPQFFQHCGSFVSGKSKVNILSGYDRIVLPWSFSGAFEFRNLWQSTLNFARTFSLTPWWKWKFSFSFKFFSSFWRVSLRR